jgi:plastocyanin
MRRATRLWALAAITVALAFALGACGSSSKGAVPASNASASSDAITIHNFNFGAPITVKVGASITVKNTDTTAHTVTADDMSFDTGHIQPGKTATITVSKAGTIKFHCDIHNYMTGSIHVTA